MSDAAYNDARFLIRLNRALLDAGLDALTDAQKMFLAVDCLNTAAMNDGLEHFFYYQGHLYDSAARGLELIGLAPIAGRLRTYAGRVFGNTYPTASAARQHILDENPDESEAAESAFGKYIEIEPLVTSALIKWAEANREVFASLPGAG
jgi:hypothetical protein